MVMKLKPFIRNGNPFIAQTPFSGEAATMQSPQQRLQALMLPCP